MKLKNEVLIHNAGSETFVVPAGGLEFSGLVRGNKTFGAIINALKKDTTESGIIEALKSRFDAPEGAVERDVHHALSELRRIGALED